jgi:hypothetical protein
VVAVQDVRLPASLEQELQHGLAEEVKPHLQEGSTAKHKVLVHMTIRVPPCLQPQTQFRHFSAPQTACGVTQILQQQGTHVHNTQHEAS